MSTLAGPALLLHRRLRRPQPSAAAVPGLLLSAWGALFLNGMTFSGESVVAIPVVAGKLITQGSLLLALLLALVLNLRGLLRPNLFLVLLTSLGVLALTVSIHNDFVAGSTYRAVRLLLFILVLWLLTPWWGRHDMVLLRCHRRVLWIVLGTVLVGAAVAPGLAFSFEGRLSGVLWPIWPTQVAHYAAILFGTSVVLWMCHVITGRNALVTLAVSAAVLGATHTRTAIAGVLIGLAVATASLFLGHVRARRLSVVGMVATAAAASFFASGLTAWALRGQSAQEATQLTGRTKVWSEVLAAHRPRVEEVFGSGLSNQSFNGLGIDSTWLGMYVDQGMVGVVIVATILLLLLIMAVMHERGPQRAIALFLVVYCVVASITETGIGSATPYQLNLAVAAALLAPGGSIGARSIRPDAAGRGRPGGIYSRERGDLDAGRRSRVGTRGDT